MVRARLLVASASRSHEAVDVALDHRIRNDDAVERGAIVIRAQKQS